MKTMVEEGIGVTSVSPPVDEAKCAENLLGVHLITERAESLRGEVWWDEQFTIGGTRFRECIRPDEISGRAIVRHVLDRAGFAELYDGLRELREAIMDGLCNSGTPAYDGPDRLHNALDAAEAAIARAEGR